jgi:membrane protease subunit HflC
MGKGSIIIVVVVLLGLLLLAQSAYVIRESHQGIILQFGDPIRTDRDPGLYFKVPFLQSLIRFEKRVLTADTRPGEYLTLDKKRLLIDHIIRWEIRDPLQYYRTVTTEVGARSRMDDIASGRLRQEFAKHNFIEIIRELREEIMEAVSMETRERVEPFGIHVLDVRIQRLDLPEEVQASVFARMRAERERIAKRYRAEGEERAREIRAAADKEREILLARAYEESQGLRGEGDARATAVTGQAFGQDAEFYAFLRRLETYENVLKKDATVVLRHDSDLLRYLESPGKR